jgi:hypothetical protein
MTDMFNGASHNRGSAFRRGIGLLLTLFIFYGTTVEAAHRHGRVLSADSGTSLEQEHTGTPASGKTGCGDCLICQLHQNFTTTLIVFRLVNRPAQLRLQITTTVPPDILSQITGPTAGRAPPSIS